MASSNLPQYQRALKWLVNQRHLCGLTQAGLSERLGKHQSFVSKFENGERRLDIAEVVEICRALGADARELVDLLTGK